MNRLHLILAAAVLCPSVGCEWMKQNGIGKPDNFPGKYGRDRELPPVAPEKLVAYLNDRAAGLQSITHAEVRVLATDRSTLMPTPPVSLTGELFAAQPRNFELDTRSGGLVNVKMFMGSNDQEFWVFARVHTGDPMYMYASHADFEAGRAKLPGGVPFEPEWVMQALGMATFSPNNRYEVKPDPKVGTYTLSWPATTPNGMLVVKEVVFNADPADGKKSQVKRHAVRDAKGGKELCYAEIKEARTERGADGRVLQYPTLMVLRWEEPQKFELKLEITNAPQINQPLTAEEAKRHFRRRAIAGVTPIDLAHARFDLPAK
ncbi:hypothetical protein GobsT_62980 [Gemmata obscuriglobus]|uniref:DUF4292 domain-containing protein n=1 Tax=Gemmata obscuriglobus TaxID=114 RepID=A0A2Z3H4N3_9BACT|nr:hypothetical protein [Gemmata obscuriglobus]AWM35960.1 hypothetical protein C1280_02335 [Gemmata obscuriglobus]QEG31476.1 hypothetical protein GobsT_62980 [Gemmata obscuriglobus]VTS10818.1 Uncharacterized protein OS=Planctomyces brasiliensis (strain ATCC 49424 / DSM 5305 / JCM 21570 / NBRC 103401 / IFAM 1448) GN=Plabr_2260 PE=4 SV=1 [Gemmata obscuriglobus UQM 2246]